MNDEAAIRKLGDEFVEAYNAGDLNRIRDFFADDLVDMSAGGPTQTGKAASMSVPSARPPWPWLDSFPIASKARQERTKIHALG